jgi:hypothetical protein
MVDDDAVTPIQITAYSVAGGRNTKGEAAVLLSFKQPDGSVLRFGMYPREAREVAAGLELAADRIESGSS